MPREKDTNSQTLALCSAIALGALIAHNLPPSSSRSKSRRLQYQLRPQRHRSPDAPPPPSWCRVPPLIDQSHYREERYYLRYGTGEEKRDLLCIVDQRPAEGTVTGPEVREQELGDRGHSGKRGFEVERYYRLNEVEAGPVEAHRVVKRGYLKWDR